MPPTIIQSVDRSLQILRCVASRDRSTLRELSETLCVKATTIHNLAGTLVARGFLIRGGSPVGYRIGPAVGELLSLSRSRTAERLLQRAVRDLAQAFPSAVVTLARYASGDLGVHMRLSPQQPDVIQRPEQRTFAPYSSASGLALLAFASEDVRAEYQRLHPWEEFAPPAWRDVHALGKVLDEARELGYLALERDGALRLALPVREQGGDPLAFLGVSLELAGTTDARAIIDTSIAITTNLNRELKQA